VTTSRAADVSPSTQAAAVLAALPLLVREARRAQGLSVRAAAAQVGCSFSTISRFENGQNVTVANAVALVRWLYQLGAVSASRTGGSEPTQAPPSPTQGTCT
jgi:transcriptional regulator with XRE-family HTH domain